MSRKPELDEEGARPIDRRVEIVTVGVLLLVAAIAAGIHLSQKPPREQVETPVVEEVTYAGGYEPPLQSKEGEAVLPRLSSGKKTSDTTVSFVKVLDKSRGLAFLKKAEGGIAYLSVAEGFDLEKLPEGEVIQIEARKSARLRSWDTEDEIVSFSNPSLRTGRGRFTNVAKEAATLVEPSGTSREVSLAPDLRRLVDAGDTEVEFTIDLGDTVVFWDFIPKDEKK